MLITIFGFPPAYREALRQPLRQAVAKGLDVPLQSVSLAFSDVLIRPPWYRGPIRILAMGHDVWRHEERVDHIVGLLCEEYFIGQGGYFYDFWFGFEQPSYANQLHY